jgi:hypothetical protein
MPAGERGIFAWQEALLPARLALFLTLLGAYLLLWVDVRLVFWNQNDLFLCNARFAREFMVSPGQPGQWLGKLGLQLCHHGWPGVLVVVALVWVLLASARGFFSRINPGDRPRDTWLIPAILLVVLHSQYTVSLSDTAGLALALAACNVYVRIPWRGSWPRLAVFVAASVLLYYVAGEAYYTFAGCCLVYELLGARRLSLGLAFLLAVSAVKFGIDGVLSHVNSAYLHFDVPQVSCLISPRAVEEWILVGLYAYFPACALFVSVKPATFARLKKPWGRALRTEIRQNGSKPDQSRAMETGERAGGPREFTRQQETFRLAGILTIWRWVLAPILVVIVAAAAVRLSHAAGDKKVLAVDYYSSRRMWDRVLEEARSLPPRVHPDYVGQDVYRALYHTGRLPYDMFFYPPSRPVIAHDFGDRGRLLSRKAFDLYLELGRVNEAETIVHNALEQHVSAELLVRIALVKMVKGQAGAARLYLNVLSDDLHYGRWARDYLRRLREDPELAGEPEMLKVRSLMITSDDTHLVLGQAEGRSIPVSVERQLLSLLDENPRNRMAFEYMMAFQLLKRDVEALVEQLPRAREFSYPEMPLLYEEALMLCAVDYTNDLVATETGVTACGWPISAETLRRCGRLQEIEIACSGLHNPTARDLAARRLGSTYLFYYFYGSGKSP